MNKNIFKTSFKLATEALRRQKTRSVLTILGISIGISIVITIMAAGKGLDRMIMGEVEVFSPDLIQIEPKVPSVKKTSSENAFGQATGITITSLKQRDIDAILKHPNISSAYGWLMNQGIVAYNGRNKSMLLVGQGHNLQEVEKFNLHEGRLFDKSEEDSLSQVAVLGYTAKQYFFGDDNPLGKTIHVKGKPFRIVGVAEKRGTTFFMDMDNMVIIPTKTLQKRIMGVDYVTSVMAKMKDRSLSKQTAEDLTVIIRDNHNITDPNKDDFAVNTMEEAIEMLRTVVNGLTFLLVALVCISLVVGGVGIMNIMYVSVIERTFEIGLMKSLGAKKKDIETQFILEAVILTLLGGAVGIVMGAIISFAIYLIAISNDFNWVYSIPISSIILAVGFSGFIGLLFGYYPAKKAANLNPIDALRRE